MLNNFHRIELPARMYVINFLMTGIFCEIIFVVYATAKIFQQRKVSNLKELNYSSIHAYCSLNRKLIECFHLILLICSSDHHCSPSAVQKD